MKTFVMTSAVLLAVLASAQAGCKYKKGPWSDCDDQNLQTRTNTLKTRRGRLNYDASCDPSQVQTRACKCKYTAEEQPCDRTTNTLTITKTLNAAKSSVGCRPELNVTKQCKPPKGCRFSKGEGPSACENNTVTIVLTLVKDKNNGTCPQTYKKTFPVRNCPDFLRKEEKRREKKAKRKEANRLRKEERRAQKKLQKNKRKNDRKNNKNSRKANKNNRKAERRNRRKNGNKARGAGIISENA